jgi:hypothetical protein
MFDGDKDHRHRSPQIASILAFVCAVAVCHIAAAGGAPLAPPFYFSAPRSAWADQIALQPGPIQGIDAVVVEGWSKEMPVNSAGLRFVVVPDTAATRDSIAQKLYERGLLADGDVVLTFRPDWADTMAYPHVQMGISHSGVIYTRSNRVYNLDEPLTEEYDGAFDSQLNSTHYKGVTAVHIMHPRTFGATERNQFRRLAADVVRAGPIIRNRDLLPFNTDYLSPRYFALHISPAESIKQFRSIIMAPKSAETPMKMYCSEFVWHMHSLNNTGGHGVVFAPMPFVSTDGAIGLGEGPISVLRSAGEKLPDEQKTRLLASMFVDNEAPQLSPGHRQTAQTVKPLMAQLQRYYQAQSFNGHSQNELSGADLAKAMNDSMPPNYSPTAFFINSFLPAEHPERRFDYLYTLLYVSSSDFQQIRSSFTAN